MRPITSEEKVLLEADLRNWRTIHELRDRLDHYYATHGRYTQFQGALKSWREAEFGANLAWELHAERLRRGDDPPDLEVQTSTETLRVEVTEIQDPQFNAQKFIRENHERWASGEKMGIPFDLSRIENHLPKWIENGVLKKAKKARERAPGYTEDLILAAWLNMPMARPVSERLFVEVCRRLVPVLGDFRALIIFSSVGFTSHELGDGRFPPLFIPRAPVQIVGEWLGRPR